MYHTKMEFGGVPDFHTDFKLFIVFLFSTEKSQEITPLGHLQICIRLPHSLDIFFLCNLPQLLADIPDDTEHRTAYIHRLLLPDCLVDLLFV